MSKKSETNKKWTSTDEYRNNFNEIFRKKDDKEAGQESKDKNAQDSSNG